jgi:hypothetical protein
MDIKKILELHLLWLNFDEKGIRANFDGAALCGANLSGLYLRGASFRNTDLRAADLRDTKLNDTNFSDADLRNANLNGTSLTYTNFKNAKLSGAEFRGASLGPVVGKEILTFSFNKHFAYSCDGKIKIGCLELSIEEWEQKYKEIGKKEFYSKKEIEMYGAFIKLCKLGE